MHLKYENINDAFSGLVVGIADEHLPTEHTTSRYGDVTTVTEPVIVTYKNPLQRVLFNRARDWPCFLALYEPLWMLAGRNDVAPLTYYNSRMSEFSDDRKTFNGAYGYRWRNGQWTRLHKQVDQLQLIIQHLQAKPDSRRAILQMWNIEDDLLKIGGVRKCPNCNGDGEIITSHRADCHYCQGTGVDAGSKDVCCNLSIKFSLRVTGVATVGGQGTEDLPPDYALDMTVFNRSNDLVWGMLGTNHAAFTFLQEYVAANLGMGVKVGVYNQITDDLHCYDKTWEPTKWLAEETPGKRTMFDLKPPDYSTLRTVPLIRDVKTFEKELPVFVDVNSGKYFEDKISSLPTIYTWTEPFFATVAQPMLNAFHYYKMFKSGKDTAQQAIDQALSIAADDWKYAALSWLEKRLSK